MNWTILRILPLLSVCLFVGCRTRGPDINFRSIAAEDAKNTRLWVVSRGVSGDQLIFAVFEGGPRTTKGLKGAVTATHNANNNGRTTVTLIRPDGTSLTLPGEVTLVEIIDGQYKDSKERVSLQDFDAFLDSRPEAFTIDNLLAFASKRRGDK